MLGIGRLLQPAPPPFVLADISIDEVLDRLGRSRPCPADDMRRFMSLPAMPKTLPSGVGAIPFEGGNQSHGSILEFVRYIAEASDTENVAPTAGGTLTINGQALGSYDYTIKVGNQTISSFSNTDWFTTTADSRSAIIVVKGDLTINSGQTLIPSHRKLFVTVYVTGNLVVNGGISMSQRGANHSAATGSNISANAIRIATGTFSSVTNPHVPAVGAEGGAGVSTIGAGALNGNPGSNGVDGQTGGAGSGGAVRSGGSTETASGTGAPGTAFTGGVPTGGRASNGGGNIVGASGSVDGGAGQNGVQSGSGNRAAGGSAGNPAGNGSTNGGSAASGSDGTGGVLFVLVEGNYSGSGTVTAAGANGGNASASVMAAGGGASGGGSVTIMVGGSDSGPTPTALGGTGGTGSGGTHNGNGGNGGNGTARKLALAA